MKFGIHLALWMKTWGDDILPYADIARRLGYDGVELSLLGDVKTKAEQIGQAIREKGLAITCTTGLGPDTDIASLDASIRENGLKALQESIETVHRLGAQQLTGVIYGAWGVSDAANREERLKWATEYLGKASHRAEELDVHLGIEAINRYETDLINTSQQALNLAKHVNSTHLGVHLDSYHMNIEEKSPVRAIINCGTWLKHYHVVDNDRGIPGSGTINFVDQVEALKEIEYDGWVTCEMFVQAKVPVSPDLTIWRSIETTPDDAAKGAIQYLKKVFQ